MNTQRKDWTGQTLYAGIDAHKAKWVVTVRTRDVQLKGTDPLIMVHFECKLFY